MKFNKSYWDQRYLDDNATWDIGEISLPLKKYIDQLENKNIKIIIPGCGNAYEAEYLHIKGFKNVYLVDLSPVALHSFNERVPDFDPSHLICDDFFNHKGKYDLMLEQTFFCAIDPTLRSRYAKHAADILRNKGKIVGLLFNDEFNFDGPPFGGNKKEYVSYFTPYFNIETMENAYNSIGPRENRELFVKLIKK